MSGKRRALVTGVAGQDGSYLAELLLKKGYEVHGFARRGSSLPESVHPHFGDLLDPAALRQALIASSPTEVYNLGAQSHVGASFNEPHYSMRVTYEPLLSILEWAKLARTDPRVYQASTSECFGDAPAPQNENSPFRPRSPYAIAKVAAHQLIGLYREAHGVFVVGGILFNHESVRRPPAFVTRKITQGVARIFHGKEQYLTLGNLEAKRDWGFAGDYVEAMWLMLQQDVPKDYVIASGSTHTVREFVIEAFKCANEFTGKNLSWEQHLRTDPKFERPAEVPLLLGNATKACSDLGWSPKVNFTGLVKMMVEHDLGAER